MFQTPKAPDPVKLEALTAKAQRLGQLKEHPSWGELRELFEARRNKHYTSLTRQLLTGAEIDQRYVDRLAGFFKGAEWILDNPEQAEKSLESAVKKAQLFTALEGDDRP